MTQVYKLDCDLIAKYQLKITYDKAIASGVIAKLNEFPNHFFVFTAKHTFGDTPLNIDKVKIYYQDNLIEAISFITLQLDIVIFIFENEVLEEISRLETIKISQTENEFKECAFSGYPNNVDSDYCEKAKYHQKVNEEDNLYRILPEQNTDSFTKKGLTNSKGYSGSGLFIQNNGKYELVGIIKEHEKHKSAFHYIALASLKDEIIEEVSVKCGILNEIGYNEESIGEITLKTVPVEVDGKVLNVSIYPVTFEEYDLYCEDIGKDKPHDDFFGRESRPVINISWYDAVEYCEWLNGYKKLLEIRLLKSMEWKKIAEKNLSKDTFIINKDNSNNQTAELSMDRAGILGICDMLGNINEWCLDGENNKKIVKGGCFSDKISQININKNKLLSSTTARNRIGFRIVFIN